MEQIITLPITTDLGKTTNTYFSSVMHSRVSISIANTSTGLSGLCGIVTHIFIHGQ